VHLLRRVARDPDRARARHVHVLRDRPDGRRQGGVAFLERDVEVIREGVAELRTGVDALLDGQDDVHRRLARIERATRGQIITAEMEEIEKAGKTPLSVFALIGGAILCGGLAFGVREGRNAGPSHPLLFLALRPPSSC
jgi:hypothetical protein